MEASASRRAMVVVVLGVVVLAGSLGFLATSLSADGGGTPIAADVAPIDSNVSAVHDANVTGEGVTVGVLDVTGFDASSDVLAGRVAGTRAFGPHESVRSGGHYGHGTASAETVARVAPDADLYLATFNTPDEYRRAVEWLVAKDVDVIVAPVSFYGKQGDGTSVVAKVAAAATREGVVFVAPAGNIAQGHWIGRYAPVSNGQLRFGDGPRNYLQGDDRDITVWLSWDDLDDDYTAELHWTNGHETRLVARSRPYSGDGVPNERIVARVKSGTYYVTVRGPSNATDATLKLSSPTHGFQHHRPANSVVAPATRAEVLTVGAYDSRGGRVEPYSSRGPTPDGRNGVDLVAPSRPGDTGAEEFVGSSAAASYAGGTVALVLAARPDLSPGEVERLLERTADDVARSGDGPVAGHGRIRPVHAVEVARNSTS